MLRIAYLALALVFALVVPATAGPDAPAKAYPDNMLVETLDNGIQVVIEERHATPIVRVHAYMKIGSIYEDEYFGAGLSHYMEHIVSGGSTRRKVVDENGQETWVGRTEDESKELLKSIGRNSNASTFYNFTQYYITTKSEMAETAMDLISDYLQNCQFDPQEVAREQRVVQQELLMRSDEPNRIRSMLFNQTMFKVHPVRAPVIGYRDCIQSITRDDMIRFYQKNYAPQNCVVAIVGDVDKDATLEQVKKYFGGWKRKTIAPILVPEEPEQKTMRWVERQHGGTKTCLVAMGVPSIPLQHPDLYRLDMLSNVLGLGAASRLSSKFEHDPSREAVATRIGTSNWTPVFGGGRFACYFGADTVENSRTLVREVWTEMQRLQEELVSEEEITRALKVLEKYYWIGRATVDDRAESLASNLAWLNDPLHTDLYLEEIRKVTPEQIREAARKYLIDEKLNVVIVTPPQPETATTTERAESEVEGQVRKVVLENGLTLLLKRIPDYGLVDVAAAFNGGVIYEDEQTNGLFFLMANSFWRGTETRPFRVLMDAVDGLGMEVESESHNNVVYAKMRCLASDIGPAFDIWSDVLLRPAIDKTWVDRVKQLLLGRVLPNLEVNPEEMMQKVIRNTLYGTHPYRMQKFGTPQTVAAFTEADVRRVYETFLRPNNCVIGVYGDIDLDETETLLKRTFGSWERGAIPASNVADAPPLAEDVTVNLTNQQVRTNVRLAWRAFSRQDEEARYALSVMGTIMGGSGWLHARLREGEADYVYSVYSAPYTGDRAGHYYVDTNFTPEDETKVMAIIEGVLEDMMAGKFTDEELALAKSMIACYDALGKSENETVVSGDALSELYGQGYDHDVKYYAGIAKVTREDVIRVARQIFESPRLSVFVRPAAAPESP